MINAPAVVDRLRTRSEERRHRRHAQRHLRDQLSSYRTQADVDDLLATIHGADGLQAEEMRSILTEQVSTRQHDRFAVALGS
jgi:truncated hemoglobin YjbI